MSKEYPRCQICGREIAEGVVYKRYEPYEPLYVCYDCTMLIGAMVSDDLPELLRELANRAEKPIKEKLEGWEHKEGDADE